MPRVVEKDGRYALLVDGAPYLMLGAQINNSSAWPAILPKVWPAIAYMHANTVEMPVYWEQLEPEQGVFDFSVVDTLLAQAREHHVHVVLLWFGTWKNGSSHYFPLWMKLAPERYPRLTGATGHLVDSPSPLAHATLVADIAAFTALMSHLKAADPEHTVLMVQVENESGTWGSVRDYSPAAQKLFNGPVPAELLGALHEPAADGSETWSQVFGPEAEEFFHAWYIARFVGQVAAAGKAVYPLPLYVNASLRDPLTPGLPGTYETGGPTDNVLAIWKAAAPSIDILAPDIYLSDSARYFKVLDEYSRPDNALLVPETGSGPTYARYCFAAIGHGAIGFSPFGIDETSPRHEPYDDAVLKAWLGPFALNYDVLAPMDREIARLSFEGRVQAVAEPDGVPSQTLDFGPWKATVSYGVGAFGRGAPQGNAQPVGRALIAHIGNSQFLVTAFYCRVDFQPSGAHATLQRQFLRVEEGAFQHGVFVPIRILNGDQTDWGLIFSSEPEVLRVTLGTY
jgi:hypothetical protein